MALSRTNINFGAERAEEEFLQIAPANFTCFLPENQSFITHFQSILGWNKMSNKNASKTTEPTKLRLDMIITFFKTL